MMNIRTVVNKNLCMGCGTCVSVCPTAAVDLKKEEFFKPYINIKKCNDCGTCLKICPGIKVNYSELNNKIFSKEPKDVLIGNCEGCFVGHSNDYKIRFDSSSGGVIASLLIYLLEKNIIDGALVTRFKEDNPLEPEPFIARTKEEIIIASKSKYCPVPVNKALKEILSRDGKFAYVGLPCHINGLRKMELTNERLRTKIIFHFGLFCGLVRNFSATRRLILKMGINIDDIKSLEYRGRGWPGHMTIVLKNKATYSVPYEFFYPFLSNVYILNRCLLCSDLTAELADISFGDAWFLKRTASKDNTGETAILVRNNLSMQLIQNAVKEKYIDLLPIHQIKGRELTGFIIKKRQLKARIVLHKLFFRDVPEIIGQDLINPTIKDYLSMLKLYLTRAVWKIKIFRFIFIFQKAYANRIPGVQRIINK